MLFVIHSVCLLKSLFFTFISQKKKKESSDVHSSLHHQGARACVQAGLLQVDGALGENHLASSAAELTEGQDGGQRELLARDTDKFSSM